MRGSETSHKPNIITNMMANIKTLADWKQFSKILFGLKIVTDIDYASVPARPLHGGATPCPYLTVPCTFYFAPCVFIGCLVLLVIMILSQAPFHEY